MLIPRENNIVDMIQIVDQLNCHLLRPSCVKLISSKTALNGTNSHVLEQQISIESPEIWSEVKAFQDKYPDNPPEIYLSRIKSRQEEKTNKSTTKFPTIIVILTIVGYVGYRILLEIRLFNGILIPIFNVLYCFIFIYCVIQQV
jgi:hypothetical protein